jgi:transcription initiation factor TFIID subunit 5
MWDINTGEAVRVFSGHRAPITASAVSPDGKYLATGADDGVISLWDIAAGKRLKNMRGHGTAGIYSLSFSQQSNVMISGGADMTVRCWDVLYGTGAPTAENPGSMNITGQGSSGPTVGTTRVDGAGGGSKQGRGTNDVVST